MLASLQEIDPLFLARLRARDMTAFGELIDNQGAVVYFVLLLLEQDASRAEAIMERTFLIAANIIENYNPNQGTLFRWLLSIAVPQVEGDAKVILEKFHHIMQSLT